MAGRKKAKGLSVSEREEIIRLSYGNSAPVLAQMFDTTPSVIRKILRDRLGKRMPWGERKRANAGRASRRKFKKSVKKFASWLDIPYSKTRPLTAEEKRLLRKRNAGPKSWRRTVKRTKKARRATARELGHKYVEFPSRQKQVWKDKQKGRYPYTQNPPRIKGRKVKGGRAVTVRNFTGTVIKKSDGTVQIVGRGRR